MNGPTIFKNTNNGAQKVCQILHEQGFKAYLVGGCVRDMFIGRPPKDWDIATNAFPERVIELFSKTIPTGLKHGTVTVVVDKEQFEVTTFRTESTYKDGRRPDEVIFVSNIEMDLSRRDFTINAMAFDPISGELVDPFNGQNDIKMGIIKAVRSPDERFQEDGLRIMRAIRFATRFGFRIEPQTMRSMSSNIHMLDKISRERINDELSKILMTEYDKSGIDMLHDCGALKRISNVISPHRNEIGYTRNCFGDLETRVAYLYLYCPIKEVQKDLTDLKFSSKEVKRVLFLLDLKRKYWELRQRGTTNAYIGFMAHIKNNSPDTWEYTYDQFNYLLDAWGMKDELHEALFKECADIPILARKEMQINGNDLLVMGIKQGPNIKKILDACYEEILIRPENNNKDSLKLIASAKNRLTIKSIKLTT